MLMDKKDSLKACNINKLTVQKKKIEVFKQRSKTFEIIYYPNLK